MNQIKNTIKMKITKITTICTQCISPLKHVHTTPLNILKDIPHKHVRIHIDKVPNTYNILI